MSSPHIRFATCTPVAFHANDNFFSRDTGLICHELQKQGEACKVIMPLPAHKDDLPSGNLQRVAHKKLSSAAWWRRQKLKGVVLYSWGDPRYSGIARAIHKAGIRLIIHFDSSGELHEHLQRPGNKLINRVKDILVNRLRKIHLGYADIITTSKPCIAQLRNDAYYGEAIAGKCREFPTPVESCFQYDDTPKQQRIICAGSWQLPVKRTGMLVNTLTLLLRQHTGVQVDICGPATPALLEWHQALPENQRSRVQLRGLCTHEQLTRLYNAACIELCTSESEGSHTASAEALCCGCSVVCPPRALLSVVRWYTSKGSGTVSREDTPEQLCSALLEELEKWRNGERNAADIATTWHPRFQVSQLVEWLRIQPQ